MRVCVVVSCAFSIFCVGASGCFLDESACPDIPRERLAELPNKLSETGLFEDIDNDVIAAGVRAYAPQFPLFTDGAKKRRWIALPDGKTIDTSDVDAWQFPVGTTLWKEFTRDDVRVETRILTRIGASDDVNNDWVAQAYLWDDDGTDATAVPEGKDDAGGTAHDVPRAALCMGCHGGTASRVLGVSAVQLGYDAPPDLLDLQDLVDEGLVSDAVAVKAVPGDDVERNALGYLHANCAHCHNQERPLGVFGWRCFDPQKPFDFALRHKDLDDVKDTAAFQTLNDDDGGGLGKARDDESGDPILVLLMKKKIMPALGTEEVDDDGVAILKAWLDTF